MRSARPVDNCHIGRLAVRPALLRGCKEPYHGRIGDLIEFLQNTTDLEVSCPKCGSSFSPRQAKLFDIRDPYPQNVIRAFKKKEGQLASALKGLEGRNRSSGGQSC